MAFCLRCQDFTPDRASEIKSFNEYQVRRTSICKVCDRRKSCFLPRNGSQGSDKLEHRELSARTSPITVAPDHAAYSAENLETTKKLDTILECRIRFLLFRQWRKDFISMLDRQFTRKENAS